MKEREKKLKESEKKKKQILLRIAPSLWDEIARWAEEDFRSINGQIEYLLAECVKKRKK
ncbi:Arc family DNA-binding protein [Ihubacter massiliensis]|uniref:Arc family DNA-binding protein n=1 Tax=Hominibacterium faecale TaxID=2839743 RepID=A0A9J6QWF3_9FIRM|nr:Arc family DNA-binding protein [Hominibacterium faecale]MCB6367464.1 Arc family DNA-binding protein [Intestinibacillus massiliensis]MCC2865791.1 Arc family DNA-binding protein [Anaerovorax odorimutans]MCI7302284.1 Arc family DNA-binding protein [Clostridia bacterium]MCO7123456.1 Arc family DNA-binding protein [Ihubacter massiliensis]MDE8734570.1 Arc family DNA-binding protein [Eubacteriales bacterium DFI.9.88]MDY3009748.1 Arc family DNA-binding protein [Clostridiales Family XIII bacterium]